MHLEGGEVEAESTEITQLPLVKFAMHAELAKLRERLCKRVPPLVGGSDLEGLGSEGVAEGELEAGDAGEGRAHFAEEVQEL